MRLRIEDRVLGFKITEPELNALLEGQTLSIQSMMTVRLIPLQEGKSDLALHGQALDFLLGPQHLNTLVDIGKNRQGIAIELGTLTVILQVDIRSDSREPCPI